MAYCTYTDVRRIINTGLEDADITSMIIQADQEIRDRDIDGSANTLKTVSTLITAALIAFKDPRSQGIGDYSESNRDPKEWRDEAENFIKRTLTIPHGRRG